MAFAALGAAALTGCGGGGSAPHPTAPVKGTVTLDGKPLPGGTVRFWPSGPGNPGFAELQKDGTFTLTTYNRGDGAVLGQHSVTVEVFPGQIGEATLPGKEATGSYQVPKKYADPKTTPLKFEVKSGNNVADLKLESS